MFSVGSAGIPQCALAPGAMAQERGTWSGATSSSFIITGLRVISSTWLDGFDHVEVPEDAAFGFGFLEERSEGVDFGAVVVAGHHGAQFDFAAGGDSADIDFAGDADRGVAEELGVAVDVARVEFEGGVGALGLGIDGEVDGAGVAAGGEGDQAEQAGGGPCRGERAGHG